MREDTFTATPEAAADYETLRGRDSDFGGGPGDQRRDPRDKSTLGPDPWAPWTCSGCGHLTPEGMPKVCPDCGLRNFGP